MSSSLIKNICGDKNNLSIFHHIYWYIVCYINNFFFNYNVDKRIKVINYNKKIFYYKNWNKDLVAPSRFLCDQFWALFPWHIFFKKKKLNFVEMGCGKGKYSLFLNKVYKKKFILNYCGIDIKKQTDWNKIEKQNKYIKFYNDNSNNISGYIKDSDVMITQSAIEHFENDILFFKKTHNCLKNKKKFIQIHMLPSKSCLNTYLTHGYRQYTCSSISKITKIFKNNTNFILFNLGSSQTLFIHLKYITLNKLLNFIPSRYDRPKEYIENLIKAVEHDMVNNKKNAVSFYGLVMLHNYSKKCLSKFIKYYN